MPEVEDPVSAGDGDSCNGNITSEAHTAGDPPEDDRSDPDFPPESFCLSKDAEFDWYDQNAFYERKESTKGMTPNYTNANPSTNNPTSSQRFPAHSNIKSKVSIIGLPKTQKHGLDPKNWRNCKMGNGHPHLFPLQTRSVGKSGKSPSRIEPTSPKVSCMGRVRSKKDPDRRENPPHDGPDGGRKSGFLSGIGALFRSGCRERQAISVHTPVARSPVTARDIRERLPPTEAGDRSEDSAPGRSSVDREPPGLGGMMRFSSGRRPDSWGAAVNRDGERGRDS